MAETVLDRRTQVADLAAAVVADARERQHVHRLVGEQARDAVRQLDLAAGAALRSLELAEDGRRQDVTPDDGQVRRRVLRARLLDDPRDALRAVRLGLHGHDAVAAGLVARHGLDAEDARPMLLEVPAHLLEAADLAVDEIVGQVHEERLVADGAFRAQHGVAEAERDALAARRCRSPRAGRCRERAPSSSVLPASISCRSSSASVSKWSSIARFDEPVTNTRRSAPAAERLFHRVLNQRLVDDRQHLLRRRFRGR